MISINNIGLKCKVSPSDKFPLLELLNNGTKPGHPFLVVCDAKHLTDIEFNNTTGSLSDGPRSIALEKIESTYGSAIGAIPSHLFSTYENLKSFLLAELNLGASVLLRRLIESFIVENFVVVLNNLGVLNLKFKADSESFSNLLDKIDYGVKMSFALEILSDNIYYERSRYKRKILYRKKQNSNVTFRNNEQRNFFNSYLSFKSATPSHLIKPATAGDLCKAYIGLSEGVHGRHIPSTSDLDGYLTSLLEGINEYLIVKQRPWMVIH
ncbi:MAG: hypothetical protein AAE985_03425 [Thermoplasmataceae archaeon]|jgi:hypothetical protein